MSGHNFCADCGDHLDSASSLCEDCSAALAAELGQCVECGAEGEEVEDDGDPDSPYAGARFYCRSCEAVW
ncbi:hypothetical protein QFW80_04130 [Luteimonas sp. M1R5S18]|uniref:Zinc ribbon domain-containing protein n=1 Tax=Luteimonas rhizosphaericola TaxID=3042024 RepID=A0ABT6JG96_9GAMM|nr:hypothetical protein [Luteimonas rhizosphaericola]MDH5829706.1 hypothetical protein [Luteimonas rhizosphaericola]